MAEQTSYATYQIPGANDRIVSGEQPSTAELHRQAFELASADRRSVDPEDVDLSRVERLGAGMIDAASLTPKAPDYYNPADIDHLKRVGEGVVALRQGALHG